ncbi:MAG: EAL domain-containing protein [Xanthomonadaceae bacterium]|nr:EAL domain-containing protein [Xanthomonadaceae bacterium]
MSPTRDPLEIVDAPPDDAHRRVPAWAWALLVLVLGMALTLWQADGEKRHSRSEAQRVFVQETEGVAEALRAQLGQCGHLIRAFQSIFLASEQVTEAEYIRAYENMQSSSAMRVGLQALAYAERRREVDGDHYVTTMFAPQSGNGVIRGLDVTTQPSNLQALLHSRDTDELAMSAPFVLRQSGRRGLGDGFILRLPVFAPGTQPGTVQARRNAIIGSIGASFRLSDLIASVLPESPKQLADLVVEDVSAGTARPLYSETFASRRDGAAHSEYAVSLQFGGRTWKVVAHGANPEDGSWLLVLGIGAAISALLAALTWSLVSTRARAITLGTSMARRFQASEERFRKLNEVLPCLVLLIRRSDGRIVYRNAAARTHLGGDDSAGLPGLLPPGQQQELQWPGNDPAGVSVHDVQLLARDGNWFWASTWTSSVELDGVSMWLLVASDTSEQRRLTERLSHQASHDSLTRLFNRREFERQVQARLATPGLDEGAILFLDLDQFKLINDTSGHRAGDELLVQLAIVMQERLRPEDVLARLGGDEFGVLLPGPADMDATMQTAERLRRSIEAFIFVWEGRSYTVSASIGVVLLRSAESLKALFAHADAACYLAKEAGRNRIHAYVEDDAAITRRMSEMEWANRVRDALRDGRLLLDYQELHPLQPGHKGAQVELLLRLRGEDGTEVQPGAFLPAAERYGLMPQIDHWVVETALGNLDRLHPDGAGLTSCSINLSAASLENEALIERIQQLLRFHQIDPQRITFEITETVAMRDFSASSALIARLRGLGCKVALDDFGAGMSSFGYLKNLELDAVKIDGSFVQNMQDDPMSQSIVRAVTEIGHLQGLQVVAEWVSTPQLCALLASMRVDYVQGFALHRPERVCFQRDDDV